MFSPNQESRNTDCTAVQLAAGMQESRRQEPPHGIAAPAGKPLRTMLADLIFVLR